MFRLSTFPGDVDAVLASPSPIGGTAPAAGTFTNLTSTGLLSSTYNGGGTIPPQNSYSIGWNYTSGNGEVDFWNGYPGAVTAFSFYQRNSASAATRLLDISPAGNLRAYGGIDNTAIGASTPSTGGFTALAASGIATIKGGAYVASSGSRVNDGNVQVQTDTTATGFAYFGANKASSYGMVFGYNTTSQLPVGGHIRQITADPIYIIVNNTATALQLASNLAATFYGAVTCNTSLTVIGALTTGSFKASSIDATPIGASTPSTGAFTTVAAASITLSGSLAAGQFLASPAAAAGAPGFRTMVSGDITGPLGYTPLNPSQLGAASGIATLDGTGKIPSSQMPASVTGAVEYQGTWNASSNSPALASGTGTKGFYYKISTAGTTNLDGNASWNPGDLVIFDGSSWDKVDGQSSEVLSVAGRTGAVVIGLSDVSGAAGLASPTFTGTVSAPSLTLTGSQSQSTVLAAPSGGAGAPSFRQLLAADVSGAAPLASPTFTGTLTVPNITLTGSQAASTVRAAPTGAAGAPTWRQLVVADISGAAPAASPTFTGTVNATAIQVGGNPVLTSASNMSASNVTATGGTAARTLAARFADWANVLDFGADPTGANDSGPAFNAAFAAKGAVYAPAGTYKISTTILPNLANMALRGAGVGVTILMNSTAAKPTIQLSSNVDCVYAWISDLTLDRSVTATAGGNGFQTDASFTFTCNQVNLFNILSQHNYYGFGLGNTAFSIADRCGAQFNQSSGFYLTNGTWNPACQWTLTNCFSQFNGYHGYQVVTVVPTQNLPSPTWSTTNPAYVTLNTWFYCTTFANLSDGINLTGSQTAPLCDWSLHGGWIGSDGQDGLYANTYGINNRLVNTAFELSSTYGTTAAGAGIGPTQKVAAPMTGNSINITANNQDWSILGGVCNQPAYDGINTAAASTTIVGVRLFNCGFAASNTYYGIVAAQGHGAVLIQGCVSGGPLAGGGVQRGGVSVYDASIVTVDGCDLRGNTTIALTAATNLVLGNIGHNLGYISRNSGVATVPSGTTSMVINHGLAASPPMVLGSANGQMPTWWIDTVTATSFTLHFVSATTYTTYFAWQASISAYA